jgi:integrase
MARQVERLTAKGVESKRKPGYHADGSGLYLQVSRSGSKSWVFRYMRKTLSSSGKSMSREMGLGSYPTISLLEARQKAAEQRKLLDQGIDPIKARNAQRLQDALEQGHTKTFAECATAYINAHRAGWRNAKHADQWTNTLETYANPVIGALPVQSVDIGLVMRILEPIWEIKTETATRVRSRIELVLDWAKVRGYRDGDNPARWRGHLDKIFPKRSKVAPVEHHEALPYADVGAFVKELRSRKAMAPQALEFIILTAARVSEAVNAKWDEFDLQHKLWIVPPERMKAHREHRVPLSDAAIKLLKDLKEKKQSDYVLPGWRVKQPLTGAACLKLLHHMGHDNLTTHGFRSTFRDWASEQTSFPSRIAEAALAHVVGDKTEAAYQRGHLLEKRRLLMQAWADYCARVKSAKVVQMRQRKEA